MQAPKKGETVKNFGLCAIFGLCAFCLLTTASPLKAHADNVTLELMGAGSNSAGGFDAYPYYFSVNGSPATTPLMCLSYYNGISLNESWTATIEPISAMSGVWTFNGTIQELYPESDWQEAAWLYTDANVNTSNNDNDQLAAWGLFSSNVAGSDNPQLTAGQAFVASSPTDPSLHAGLDIYVPLSGWPQGDDVPQIFIGYAPTPEPGGLILLGSGLLALAGGLYRRRHAG